MTSVSLLTVTEVTQSWKPDLVTLTVWVPRLTLGMSREAKKPKNPPVRPLKLPSKKTSALLWLLLTFSVTWGSTTVTVRWKTFQPC